MVEVAVAEEGDVLQPGKPKPKPTVEPVDVTGMPETVNEPLGQKLKDEGIERVSRGNGAWLLMARTEALNLCKLNGTVSCEELRQIIKLPEGGHDNLWGAVFSGLRKTLMPISIQSSATPERHAGLQRVWQFRTARG
jgi:hypothetical protein